MWWTAALIALPAAVLAASSCVPGVLDAHNDDGVLRDIDGALGTAIDAEVAHIDEPDKRAMQFTLLHSNFKPDDLGRYLRLCKPVMNIDKIMIDEYTSTLETINVETYCADGSYEDCLLYLELFHYVLRALNSPDGRNSYSDRCSKLYANPTAPLKQLAFCLSVADSNVARPTFSMLQRYSNLINALPETHRSAYQALMVIRAPVLCAAQFFIKSEDMAAFCKDAYGSIYGHFNEVGNTMEGDLNDILNTGIEGNSKLLNQLPGELDLLTGDLQDHFKYICGEIIATAAPESEIAVEHCRNYFDSL
ncbi:hypothetical protein PSACC_01932 [Paramicrosporidium saccamoebae]|uniref:Secreted protein n=1 Tax=Paramicrosporidium saccamoebae TaxID=1246581 RepID=A0A2H9TKF3_9FUNG|nr:hypothetical protein PSACC_01932 [Paramicrosporidium saccamoebae]